MAPAHGRAGHDERDWAFATQYQLPIREVIQGGQVDKAAFVDTDRGRVINSTTPDGSCSIDGLLPSEAIPNDCLVGSCREGEDRQL